MNHKVWVIPDDDWEQPSSNGRVIDARKRECPPELIRTAKRPLPDNAKKSPALSFSFSMFIWGSGQMYARDYGSGVKFMASMLFFYMGLSYLVFAQDSVTRFFSGIDIPVLIPAIGLVVFFVAGLVTWLCNAIDAYYRAIKEGAEPFRGVNNGIWPLLCSSLFPGWGQFLNGQPRKGFVFLLVGLIGVVSVFVLLITQHAWPFLKTSHDRFVFEIYLVGALLAAPLSMLMWIVSMYDAFRSNRELSIKKPGLPYAGKRMRKQGVVQGLVPRGTMILGLLLAVSVGMQCIPKTYYLNSLENIRLEMLRNNMGIVPEVLGRVIGFVEKMKVAG